MSPLPGGRQHCDPIRHVSSRSGEAGLRTATSLYFTFCVTPLGSGNTNLDTGSQGDIGQYLFNLFEKFRRGPVF